ncbi:hypothetical protein TNCV_979881 [Trichonephila clavipes]|uniref:Uncharacterized protein n=1 Tax=Trichonephila clavipes TaxID=2585209 RepID=A0A8X6S1B4_TRICX|nr:hypothetical protein TNCV_979881 [Trichonephila clavipes]
MRGCQLSVFLYAHCRRRQVRLGVNVIATRPTNGIGFWLQNPSNFITRRMVVIDKCGGFPGNVTCQCHSSSVSLFHTRPYNLGWHHVRRVGSPSACYRKFNITLVRYTNSFTYVFTFVQGTSAHYFSRTIANFMSYDKL